MPTSIMLIDLNLPSRNLVGAFLVPQIETPHVYPAPPSFVSSEENMVA